MDICSYRIGIGQDLRLSCAEKLQALPMDKPEARMLGRFFIAGAIDAEVDKQGRILVPPTLRSFAELDKDVVLAGVGHRIEIWSKARWDGESVDGDMDEIAATMDKLGITLTQ